MAWFAVLCLLFFSSLPVRTNFLDGFSMASYTLDRPLYQVGRYGKYCGVGGSGEPVDCFDACCQVHDQCYGQFEHCTAIPWYLEPYEWKTTITDGVKDILCDPANSNCSMFLCDCDKALANCFKENIRCFNQSHVREGDFWQSFVAGKRRKKRNIGV